MCEALARGEKIPFDPTDATIYYVGPTPAKPGHVIGSAGATTNGRMDAYAPRLIELGLAAMIGKGPRSEEVCRCCVKYGAVYLAAAGGAGAYMASCVKECQVIAFKELQSEAVHRLRVENMLLVTAIDAHGGNLFNRD